MAFEYTLTKEGRLAILTMQGRLVDKVEAVEISVEIDEELEEGTHHFIIDLSGLEYMNSTGLNILINLMNRTRNEGGEAIIVGAKPRIDVLFSVTKLNSVFNMMKSVEEARAHFSATMQRN
jgi:anti-anti-sigma factor